MAHVMDSLSALSMENLDLVHQVISELPVPCLMLDREHRVLVWNKACEAATGYPAAKMIGTRDAWRAFYPEERPTLADLAVDGLIFQELQNYYAGQVRMSSLFDGVVEIEAFFPLVGERGRWLQATVTQVCNPAGEIIGALEVLHDVDAMRLAEQRTSTLFNATPDAMLVVDAKGKVVMANQMAETSFGYSAEELIGLSVEKLVPDRFRAEHAALRKNFAASTAPRPSTQMALGRFLLAVRRDGSEFPAEIGLNRVAIGGETVTICSIRDVTVQRRIQQELREAKEMAEAATRAKSEFLANMSHEIRTPMNAIIGLTKLAMRGSLPERERDYVRKANAAAESLLGILNDLLDFSKIEAGKLAIEYTAVDLEELLGNLVSTFSHQAQEKGLAMCLDVAADVPRMIECDPLRLNQVLGNLCSNAIKFTESGSVSIRVRREELGRANTGLCFEVADTGIGLSPEQQAGLFQSFYQADGSISRKYGGSGLGLAISKRLVAMMGGDIRLESSLGAGTTVQVLLPASEACSGDHSLSGKRILIVEDNDLNRVQMESMCRWFGMATTGVSSALQARMALRQAMAGNQPFDLLLVDWLMPEEDGLSCIRLMRQEFAARTPPAVLVTSAALEEVENAVRQSGLELNSLITKPLNARRLSTVLSQALDRNPAGAERGIAQFAAVRGARILLVDDNDLNRQVGREWLLTMESEVLEADGGQAALDILAREPVDAILMDCQMPVMDGLETTRRIRANPAWKDLPIIAVSASAMESDVHKALAAGMNDFLAKPLQEEALYRTLARRLGREAARPEAAPAAGAAPAQVAVANPIPDIPGLDTALGLRNANKKPELYRIILAKFADSQRNLPENYGRAVAAGDRATALRLIHILKSGLGYIGAQDLAKEADELERAFRQDEPWESLEPRFQALAPKLAELVGRIGAVLE